MFADDSSHGDAYQNQQQEQQHKMARVSTVDNGEIDYDEMPDFVSKIRKRLWNQKCSNQNFSAKVIIRVRQMDLSRKNQLETVPNPYL